MPVIFQWAKWVIWQIVELRRWEGITGNLELTTELKTYREEYHNSR